MQIPKKPIQAQKCCVCTEAGACLVCACRAEGPVLLEWNDQWVRMTAESKGRAGEIESM